jgi:hypothetical protein
LWVGETAGFWVLVSGSLFSARLGLATTGSAGFADGVLTKSTDLVAGILAVKRPITMPMHMALTARTAALIARVRTRIACAVWSGIH